MGSKQRQSCQAANSTPGNINVQRRNSATSEQPKDKITMERTLGHVDAAGDLGCPVEVVESNRKRQEEENQKDTDDEQQSEYDTESESKLPATVDRDLEDEMTFLRAVTTRSGRTIRVTSKFF